MVSSIGAIIPYLQFFVTSALLTSCLTLPYLLTFPYIIAFFVRPHQDPFAKEASSEEEEEHALAVNPYTMHKSATESPLSLPRPGSLRITSGLFNIASRTQEEGHCIRAEIQTLVEEFLPILIVASVAALYLGFPASASCHPNMWFSTVQKNPTRPTAWNHK